MLRVALVIVHLAELVLYSWIYQRSGGGAWVWLSTVLALGLGLRAIIIALTMVIARVPVLPPGTALGGFAAEFFAAVRLYSFDAIIGAPALIAPSCSPPVRPPPVLFVHGFMCNAGFWRQYLKEFAPRWGNYLATINLQPLHGSIELYTDQIDQRVDELLRVSGARTCLLVAHSMGGLAVRSYLRTQRTHDKIAGVVTLGTPHTGTRLAHFSFAANARQMRCGSDWLRQLGEDEAAAQLPPFAALVGSHDNIVAPQENASYVRAANTYMFGITHLAMALNRQVIDWTFERLARISAASQTSACANAEVSGK